MGDEAKGEIDVTVTPAVSRASLQEPDEDAGKCGYGDCTPNCLQRFHNPPWLLASLCFMVIVQGFIVTGLMGSVISTLERRFNLSSTQTGLIATTYDMSVALVLIPVTYYGGHQHKGKWLAYGSIIMGVGSLVMVIPQFTTDVYKIGSSHLTYCSASSVNTTARPECLTNENLSDYIYVFILSQFLIGLGASPMFSLTFVYLDENLSSDSSALYIGIYYAVSILGPALGFLLGGYFLNTYGDVGFVDVTSLAITKDDPQWYGAWWIGYILCGILALIAAFPLFCYARELPGAAARRHKSYKETDEHSNESGFGTSLKDLPAALKNIFQIPTFVLLALCDSLEALAVAGAATFMPKYLETQYGLSSGLASIVAGGVMIPAGGGGAILGGIIIKKWKLGCSSIMKGCIVALTLSSFFTIAVLASCPNRDIAGVTVPYFTNTSLTTISSCNADCNCRFYAYDPVCADERIEYLTPCFAGCTNFTGQTQSCRCTEGTNQILKYGACPATCTFLPLFLTALFFIIFFGFCASTPTVQATLRCVPFKQRSLATGVSWIFVRCLGAIPSPLIFGALLDGVCLKWGEHCGEKTSCQIYANEQASYRVVIGVLSCKVMAVLFMVLAWKMYRPPQDAEPLENHVYLEAKGETNMALDMDGTAPNGDVNSMVKLDSTGSNGGPVSSRL
ncbi:solute carrier organic anion transporter family member 4C1-like [Lineus longissimus]|uniref:solute carrier organic anion transporter family member 4C1-like n=1 Tax=Lineus longissimus TaxID=88925 RepID=UPI002B4EC278